MGWWEDLQGFFNPETWNTSNLNFDVMRQTGLGGGGVAPYSLMTPSVSALQDYRDAGLISRPATKVGVGVGSGPTTGFGAGPIAGPYIAGKQAQLAAAEREAAIAADIASLLSGTGGGGGFDASIYDPLFEDLKARQSGIQRRYDTNMADIESLYANAAIARERDREAVNAAITQQLADAQARRAQEMGATREAEAQRLATYNQGREALGVAPAAADMATKTVEGGLSRYSERGAAADRDQEIARSIAQQQIQSELSGYTSAQELASRALSNTYEDRLAQIASERSALRAQIAQQRAAAAAASRGPSVQDKIAAMQFVNEMYNPTQTPVEYQDDNAAQVFGWYQQNDPRNAGAYSRAASNWSQYLAGIEFTDQMGKDKSALQVANEIIARDSSLSSAYDAIVQALQAQGLK